MSEEEVAPKGDSIEEEDDDDDETDDSFDQLEVKANGKKKRAPLRKKFNINSVQRGPPIADADLDEEFGVGNWE